MFWFIIGNYIAYKKDKILNILHKNYLLYFSVFASCLMAVILNIFTPNFAEIAIVVYATLLFLLAIKNPTVHISKAFEFIGGNLSLNVYIWHIIVARVFSVFINHLGFAQNDIYLAIRPIVVVIFTLLVSLIMYKIQNYMFSLGNKNTNS